MAVRYIRVNPVVEMFSPAIRPTGNLAILGTAVASATPNVPVQVTSPNDARTRFGVTSDLTKAIKVAFDQTPGPSQVWGIPVNGGDVGAALTAIETADVQFVVVANTPLTATSGASGGAIAELVSHVVSVSNDGGDGKERMGVAMLAKGSTDATVLIGALVEDRMVYVAHKSDDDVAAAVAATIAGYDPHVSILLKQVSVNSAQFTDAEVDAINGSEADDKGPAGKGVNWLVDPALIPGPGVYMGEGYTGNVAGKKYIDVVRTVDDASFRLKARLIRSIGSVRITRAGLRSLVVQMEGVLDPLVQDAVIDGYEITVPVLNLLDVEPAARTPGQRTAINNAQTERMVEVLIAIDYAGAIHRLLITLKFE
jgi:hypothetical protein